MLPMMPATPKNPITYKSEYSAILPLLYGKTSHKAKIIRKTSATQEIVSEILSSNSSVVDSATRTAGTQDLTTALTIRCIGTGGASSDITQYALKINLTPST